MFKFANTHAELAEQLDAFCNVNAFPKMSAEELLFELDWQNPLHHAHVKFLLEFMDAWKEIEYQQSPKAA